MRASTLSTAASGVVCVLLAVWRNLKCLFPCRGGAVRAPYMCTTMSAFFGGCEIPLNSMRERGRSSARSSISSNSTTREPVQRTWRAQKTCLLTSTGAHDVGSSSTGVFVEWLDMRQFLVHEHE